VKKLGSCDGVDVVLFTRGAMRELSRMGWTAIGPHEAGEELALG
jgi:hypothetical protein